MTDAKFVHGESELSFPGLSVQDIDMLALLDLAFIVCNFVANELRGLSQPFHSLALVWAHAPSVPARKGIQKHARRMILFSGVSEVVGGLIDRSIFMTLNTFGEMFFSRHIRGRGSNRM